MDETHPRSRFGRFDPTARVAGPRSPRPNEETPRRSRGQALDRHPPLHPTAPRDPGPTWSLCAAFSSANPAIKPPLQEQDATINFRPTLLAHRFVCLFACSLSPRPSPVLPPLFIAEDSVCVCCCSLGGVGDGWSLGGLGT